jgi:hypothetical protein
MAPDCGAGHDARSAALFLLARGWVPVPIPSGRKGPTIRGWSDLRVAAYSIDRYFPIGRPSNVGVLLGEPSGGLIDIDLDSCEAVAAAVLLPGTGLVWGRLGVPCHRGYVVADPPAKATQSWDDPVRPKGQRSRLLELRSTGGQTLVPPSVYPIDSVHQVAEPCEWVRCGEPARVDLRDLVAACNRVAAAALLARYWRVGVRHDAALALAGGLARAGWDEEGVERFGEAVAAAAGDDELVDRVRAARDTFARLASGEPTTGWPTLVRLLGGDGEAIVRAACSWLDIQARGEARGEVRGEARAAPAAPAAAQSGGLAAWEVIRDYFRERYRPGFRNGDALFSVTEGREVKRGEACAALPPDLIDGLAGAVGAPCTRTGEINHEALPRFFRTWAGTAWTAVLRDLPVEEEIDPRAEAAGAAAEEFRRLVSEAMLTPLVLGQQVPAIQYPGHDPVAYETKLERRPLIEWCVRFANPEGGWSDIRSLRCWCRVDSGGRLVVAIRHELFAQIRADRRLIDMGGRRFNALCRLYGVGRPGGQQDRPCGHWAVILDDELVADLVGGGPDLETESTPAG